MGSMNNAQAGQPADEEHRVDTLFLIGIAAAITLLHLLTNSRYGFHRDEFQFLSDARHLDWGFVAYPPFTPFVERIGLVLFGTSLVGLRLFSVLAQAAAIVVTGLMARELGGKRLAQVTAALAVALSPLPLFEGTEFQYSTFDYLWWVLAAYFIIRLLKSDTPRWWLAIGAVLGLGLQTKYSILFFITGILGAMLLTRARRYFLSPWFWGGVAVALAIFLPNLLWQIRHDFISYQFLQHIHTRDVRQGRADGFLRDQFRICVNFAATPLWLAGLVAFLVGGMRGKGDSRYRTLGWMYLIPLALFFFAKGRGYYLAAAYPMLLARGAVAAESWLTELRPLWRRTVEGVFFTGLAACGIYICCVIVPLAPNGPLRDFALANNGDLREEIGWDQMLKSIAQVRDSLPPEQQANLGIVVGNYGEHGAVEILGPAYHLPTSISGTNSAWLRTYPQSQPTTLIVLGVGDDDREKEFTGCRLASHIPYPENLNNEESNDHSEIYICGPPRRPWPELWKIALSFG
jgi:hypothetical protein